MKYSIHIIALLFLILPAANCGKSGAKLVKTAEINPQVMEHDSLKNRQPAVAGTFYPGSAKELTQELQAFFAKATPSKHLNHIVALIAPHAGYVYSGEVAASSFRQLSPDHTYDNVFIIGSSHHASFDGASVYNIGNFITPLGEAKVNIDLTNQMMAAHPDVIKSMPDVHRDEHSLEVEIPFLQYIYKENLQIVPVLLGTNRIATIRKIADALKPYFGGNNLFVISTDFSHYPDYNSAVTLDKVTADAITKNSPDYFIKTLENNENKNIPNLATSICGWTSVMTLLDITSEMKGIQYHEINYMNSGDVSYGDKSRVVGYNAMAVTGDQKQESGYLNEREKKVLLHIARVTIEEYLKSDKIPEVTTPDITDKLRTPAGAFVTLNEDNQLRGCIGQFSPDQPLYKVVQEMAVSSATRDYRFSKVKPDELSKIRIEISVLTPMRKIQSINEIQLGKHGIYIKKGNSGGTFLPQVATQTGWTLDEFLGHCARDKAGIGWDGWKDAEIYVYEAYVFGEE
jgi:MEMO1 family protein